jgi:hypothetical protein
MKALRLTAVGMVFLMAAIPGALSGGQISQQTTQLSGQIPTPPSPGHLPSPDLGPPSNPRMEEQQEKARSTERQKRLVADTDKLLALATELKTDVDKTNKNILSMDVIKKADEIEKLAHSVKERMKGQG